MSKSKSKQKIARKKWIEELNYFYIDDQSSYEHPKFKNRPAAEITNSTIALCLRKHGIVKPGSLNPRMFYYPDKSQRGTKMHRTYIYRAMVIEKIYDGNRKANETKTKPKTAGNWGPVDKAIDKWNEEWGSEGLRIENGKLYSKKQGRKELEEDDALEAFLHRKKTIAFDKLEKGN
jgi:hypothetical protein